jgi:hypothetical protein
MRDPSKSPHNAIGKLKEKDVFSRAKNREQANKVNEEE